MNESLCNKCGTPLSSSGECIQCSRRLLPPIFRREVALLAMLYLLTIPLFLATRAVAARNRRLNITTAGAWYAKGQEQLKGDDLPGAILSFRKAATSDHDNPRNVLALAEALSAANHNEEARQMLLQIRAADPESGEINLQLARLAAKDRQQETVRYYHYALDGIWPENELTAQKRRIRTELVRFLLESEDRGRALSELLILSSDIPDEPDAHNELGGFFLQATDPQRALQQFTRTLTLDKSNGPALLGAGKAAFNLGDYRNASRYLRDAWQRGFTDPATDTQREIAQFAISEDPLVPGLMIAQRIHRLTAAWDLVSQRLRDCRTVVSDPSNAEILETLEKELQTGMKTSYRPAELRQNAEAFRSALELISRVEDAFDLQQCPGDSSEHRALVLIVKKYGVIDQ